MKLSAAAAQPPGILFKISLCFLLILCTSFNTASAAVILHAFNWNYSEVAEHAQQIADNGYSIVLVSPPLKSTGPQWWARYQPQDYRIIDNPLGNTHDFKSMVATLQNKNIAVYADIVLNHMANEAWKRPDLNYPGQEIIKQYSSNPNYYASLKLFGDLGVNLFSAADFHARGCITNYNDKWQVQNLRLCGGADDPGLPDLTPNPWVVEQQQLYLNSLKNVGVSGFRVDAAKHMSNDHINKVFTPAIKSNMHIFGEIITNGGAGTSEYDTFLKPYLDETGQSAYDFPLFSSLFKAMKSGGSLKTLVDPLAYGQALPPEKAITFVTTHDIPNNAGFRYLIMDKTDETLAYAYILGRDGGVPMVYSDHNESNDNNRWLDAYKDPTIVNMIRFHNSVQGQPVKMVAYNDCALLFTRGAGDAQGIVGINKCGFDQHFDVNTDQHKFYWHRLYTNQLNPSTNKIFISQSSVTFTIPARSASMWLLDKTVPAVPAG